MFSLWECVNEKGKDKINMNYLTPQKGYPYASAINPLKDFISRPGNARDAL